MVAIRLSSASLIVLAVALASARAESPFDLVVEDPIDSGLEALRGADRRLEFFTLECPKPTAGAAFLALVLSPEPPKAEDEVRWMASTPSPLREKLECLPDDVPMNGTLTPFERADGTEAGDARWLLATELLRLAPQYRFQVQSISVGGKPVEVVAWDEVETAIRARLAAGRP